MYNIIENRVWKRLGFRPSIIYPVLNTVTRSVWNLVYSLQAWELSSKTQISARVKLTFGGEKKKKKKNARGKKLNKKQKHAGSTDFSSTPNTREIIEARSHAAMARFSRLIMNTAAAVTVAGRY